MGFMTCDISNLDTALNSRNKQEAQLALRNRASAMYYFLTFYRRNDL